MHLGIPANTFFLFILRSMICVTTNSIPDITESSLLSLEFMDGDMLMLSFSSVTNGCCCCVCQHPSCPSHLQIFPVGVDNDMKLSLWHTQLYCVFIWDLPCDRGGAHALEMVPYRYRVGPGLLHRNLFVFLHCFPNASFPKSVSNYFQWFFFLLSYTSVSWNTHCSYTKPNATLLTLAETLLFILSL